MSMKFTTLLALGTSVLLATSAPAQQGNSAQAKPAAKPAAPAAPAAQAAPATPAKFVGTGETIASCNVKNPSTTGSIAGLKISEFWYDKSGNPVSGDEFRYRKPLMPGEVIDVELRTPVKPTMANSQYKFEQSNGSIKPNVVPKL